MSRKPGGVFDKRSDMRKLLIVVEEGKIHSAAEKLHITQPALSRVIAKLERQFNGQIFERIPKGVRLTEFGHTVVDQVRHLLREFELAEEEINSTLDGARGLLRVSAGPVWMQGVLPRVIEQFHEKLPQVELILSTTSYREGIKLLREGKSDLHCGFFTTDERLPIFMVRESFRMMHFSVLAHAHHPIHSCEKPSFSDLLDYPWIDFEMDMDPSEHQAPSPLNQLLQELQNRTGRRAEKILRTNSVGLHLMASGPYLTYLCSNLASNLSGVPLQAVAIDVLSNRLEAGMLSRRSAEGLTPLKQFKKVLQSTAFTE